LWRVRRHLVKQSNPGNSVAQIKSTLTNSASSNISDRDANGNLALARSIASERAS